MNPARGGSAETHRRRALRVLTVGPLPPPLHGVTVMTAALLDAVRSSGWRVVHIDTSDHRSIDSIGRFDLVNVAFALLHVVRFTQALLHARPDVVYLPLSQGLAGFTRDGAFLLATRLSCARVVVHAHGGQYQEFFRRMPPAVRVLMRYCMARVNVILVLAETQRAQFDGWASPTTRVEVIPNGVRDEWPDGRPSRLAGHGGTVLFLGNLLPEKGFLDVLDAGPLVLESVPEARFVFAGRQAWDPSTAARVSGLLRQPGLGDATEFVGVVGSVERRRLLEEADILVFPPRWDEGQPLVALEAMSAGLPLVATASGGLAETVRDGVDAIVVPKSSPQAVAAAVTKLLRDPALRERMGRAARERYELEYTLDRWTLRMRGLFDAELSGHA